MTFTTSTILRYSFHITNNSLKTWNWGYLLRLSANTSPSSSSLSFRRAAFRRSSFNTSRFSRLTCLFINLHGDDLRRPPAFNPNLFWQFRFWFRYLLFPYRRGLIRKVVCAIMPQSPIRIFPVVLWIIQPRQKRLPLGRQLQQIHDLCDPGTGKAFFPCNLAIRSYRSSIEHSFPLYCLIDDMLLRLVNLVDLIIFQSFFDGGFLEDLISVTCWIY